MSESLLTACGRGKLSKVRKLVEAGADVNHKSSSGQAGLHVAAIGGQAEVAAYLLENGAEVDIKTEADKTPLMTAAGQGTGAVLEVLLRFNADVNLKDKGQQTALMYAASRGYRTVVDLLLSHGADIDARDKYKQTALLYAIDKEHKVIVERLLRQGADVNVQDDDENTALHFASSRGYRDVTALLLKSNALVNVENKDKDTALMKAAANGHREVVEQLIQYRADVNKRNKNRETALIKASKKGHRDTAALLLQHNANSLNTRDRDDRTALIWAAKLGYRDVAELLLYHNAALEVKDKNNKTAFNYAEEYGKQTVIDLLKHKVDNICIPFKYFDLDRVKDYLDRSNDISTILPKHVADVLHAQKDDFLLSFLELALSNLQRSDILNSFIGNDPNNISLLLSFISRNIGNYEKDDFVRDVMDNFVGSGCDLFCVVDINNSELLNKSLLHHIINEKNGMLKQREELLDLLINKIGLEERQLIELLKKSVPSSEGLTHCIRSGQERYKFGTFKVMARLSQSFFIHILLGWGLYLMDLGTDLTFTRHLFKLSEKNFAKEKLICEQIFLASIDNFTMIWRKSKGFEKVEDSLEHLKNLVAEGQKCVEREQLFADKPHHLEEMGFISLTHSLFPIMIAVLLYPTFMFYANYRGLSDIKLSKLPNPVITKLYSAVVDFRITFLRRENNADKSDRDSYDNESLRNIDKLKKLYKKRENHEGAINLSLIIEAVTESSFMFWYQIIFLLPGFVFIVMDVGEHGKKMTDLFNWKIFSILTSFTAIALSYCNIKNREKKGAMNGTHYGIQILRIFFDASSRIIIFSCFMFTYNDGIFHPLMTLAGYYTTFGILLIFNMALSRNRNVGTISYWLGVVLNSLSSVLTYNIYNFENKDKKQKFLHQSTFISQLTYFFIFVFLLLGLTISTLMNLKEEMVLLDVNGVDHNLPISVVHYMLALGWGCFFLGWVMNLIFYGVHPCDVSLSPSSIREKLPDIPIPQSPQPFNGNETYQENVPDGPLRRLMIPSSSRQVNSIL